MSEDLDSSEEEIELISYQNELTENLSLPEEPKLWCIYDGKKFVKYDDSANLDGEVRDQSDDSGSEESEDQVGFLVENYRTHSEYMTLK